MGLRTAGDRPRLTRWCAALLAVVTWQATARAADGGERVALVIGNGTYEQAESLPNAVNDARAVAAKLESLGFDTTLLVDATREQTHAGLTDFAVRLGEGADTGLFYYAGHGLQASGVNYLVPVDAQLETQGAVDWGQAVRVDAVLDKMARSRSKTNLLILDACRNNPFERSLGRTRGGPARGLAVMAAPGGTMIAYATAPGSVAIDGLLPGDEHGVYTKALLSNIDIPGLGIEQVFKRTGLNVDEATRGAQIPWTSSSLRTDFYFVPASGPDAQKLFELAVMASDHGNHAGVVAPLVQALESETNQLGGAQRQTARHLLALARSQVATVELDLEPAEAGVQVDGWPAERMNGLLLLNPGEHAVEFQQAGFASEHRTVTVAAGDERALRVRLAPVTPATPARPDKRAQLATWLPIATGGALLATALGTGIRSWQLARTLERECGSDGLCPEDDGYDWRADRRTGQALSRTADVALAFGAVGVAAGLVLHFWRARSERRVAEGLSRLDLSCGRSGCRATYNGHF